MSGMSQSSPAELESSVSAQNADAMPLRFGKYTLLRKLATGGMAELFLALHRSVAGFEKLVVIKRILPAMNQDQAFIEMLLHEARVAATISHPNIVQVFDVGFFEDTYYIAMEHIHGEDLRAIVRQMKLRRLTEFPVEHALAIALGTCSGISYAHEKRALDGSPLHIVHRDISPQNILVTYTGDVKVVDFGIAKSRIQVGEETRTGHLKGKVPYMSPEQARGEDIDFRSDVFSTGIVLFELTTGRRLFKGSNELETLRLICDKEYPRPSQARPGYPARLEAIVMRALAKDRNERYATAREMQSDLEAYVRDERIPVSDIELSRWMQTLFEDKLVQQKAVLQDVKQLADVIAAQNEDLSSTSDTQEPSSTSGPALVPSSPPPPMAPAQSPWSRARRIFLLGLASGVLALSLLSGSYLCWRRPDAAREAASSSSTLSTGSTTPSQQRGSVMIRTDPPNASVWINGELRAESTPATLEALPLGVPIQVKLTADGYAPELLSVVLTDVSPVASANVTLKKGTVTLNLTSSVPKTAFYLDGKPVGSKVEGVSASEEHKVSAVAEGYAANVISFTAGPNESKTVRFDLEKEKAKQGRSAKPTDNEPSISPARKTGTGKLNVGSRGGYCTVSVDGTAYGPTPVGGITVPAGTHRVSCRTEAGKSQSMVVTVEPDQTTRVSFSLTD